MFRRLLGVLFIAWEDPGSETVTNRVGPWKKLERIQEVLEKQLLHLNGPVDWKGPGQHRPGAQVLLSPFISKGCVTERLDDVPISQAASRCKDPEAGRQAGSGPTRVALSPKKRETLTQQRRH